MKHFSEGNYDSDYHTYSSKYYNEDEIRLFEYTLNKKVKEKVETEQERLERLAKKMVDDLDNDPKLLQEFNYQLRKRKIEQLRNKKTI